MRVIFAILANANSRDQMSVDERLAKIIRKVDKTCVTSSVTPTIVDLLEIIDVK